jgi:hypothetical protein
MPMFDDDPFLQIPVLLITRQSSHPSTLYNLDTDSVVKIIYNKLIWDITPCGPLKPNRRFGGTCRLHLQGRKISWARNQREGRWKAEIFRHWRWRQHVPPKCRLTFNRLHGVISQKTDLFITKSYLSQKSWSVDFNKPKSTKFILLYKIWSSHSGEYKDFSFPVYDVWLVGRYQCFGGNLSSHLQENYSSSLKI